LSLPLSTLLGSNLDLPFFLLVVPLLLVPLVPPPMLVDLLDQQKELHHLQDLLGQRTRLALL
jgi:hypothetical protein